MKTNIVTKAVAALVLAQSAIFAADEFKEVSGIVSAGVTATQTATGGFAYTLFGILPFATAIMVAVLAVMYAVGQNNDNKSGMAIAGWGVGGAIGGAVAGIVIVTALGSFMFKDSATGYKLFNSYWNKAVTSTDSEAFKETTFE